MLYVRTFLDCYREIPSTYQGSEGMEGMEAGEGSPWALAERYFRGSTFRYRRGGREKRSSGERALRNQSCMYGANLHDWFLPTT